MRMTRMAGLRDPFSMPPANQFLAGIVAGLAKRRRALRTKTRSLAVEQTLEGAGAEEQEKLEVSIRTGTTALRFFVWDDRWVFVDARTPTTSKGWAWEFTHEGRFIGSDLQGLVEALEASIDHASEQSGEELYLVWKPLLAAGPRPVP